MDITAIGRSGPMLHAPSPVISADKAAENREVVQAVNAINGAEMFARKANSCFNAIR